MRPLFTVSIVCAFAAGSLYLAARSDASLTYAIVTLLHVVVGVGLTVVLARVARRGWQAGRTADRAALVLTAFAALLGIALATGGLLPIAGMAGLPPGTVDVHVWAAALAAVLWLIGPLRRHVTARAPRWLLVAACLLTLAAPAGRYLDARFPPRSPIVNPAMPPAAMDGEGGGPDGPFFPSAAETTTGRVIPAALFMSSESCGRCHEEIYEQWRSSVHHLSSFNNQWYRKSIEYMQDVVGTKPSRWCAGCHDHALLFAGTFDTPIREQIDTPEAQAGLGCMSCHAIVHVKSTMGQGDFTIEYPAAHALANSDQPLLQFAHDYLLYLDPEPHRRAFIKSFHREQSAEFCASCHKVHLDVPVNSYRWLRGFNEYDNWQASGVSGQGARSFYYPPEPRTCTDCHMPLVPSRDPAARDGKIRSHRFPGANTALPFVNGDEAQLRLTQAFLRANQVSVDIFGLVRTTEPEGAPIVSLATAGPRAASTFAVGEESMAFGTTRGLVGPPAPVLAPLDAIDAAVRPGESVRIEVVVRTRNVGHFFPGGTVDAQDVWVEFEAVDADGRTIFHSGGLLGNGRGPVDPGAHFYRSVMLDAQGNVIDKRNAWMTRSVAYVRLVPPGAADTIHYRLEIPPDARGPIALRAKVNYRKFAWWNTQWSYAGIRDPADASYSVAADHDSGRWIFTGDTSGVSGTLKAIPDLPVTVMAEASATLEVAAAAEPGDAKPARGGAELRGRWNDYGIGLLLQGDLKGAEAAFLEVTRLDPAYADGWVNIGRARLQEGDADEAETALRTALERDPALAKTHVFLGLALKAQGRDDEAIDHLQRAAEQYPRDRVVLNQLGRMFFRQRRYADTITLLQRVLAIDPEDLEAHYTLMLAYRGLGDLERAGAHEIRYRRFKADESSQVITGPYRQLHPADNNERQAVHEHRSAGRTR